jgi:hypothetical protein
MQTRSGHLGRSVRLLDLDPDLGHRLADHDFQRAHVRLAARVWEVEPGAWAIRPPGSDRGAFGLLITDGVLGLRTSLGDRTTLELVGRGDLLQPWVQLDSEVVVPPTTGWQVIQHSKLLLLDRTFARAVAPWPEVTAALMHRLVVRNRRLCYQLAVNASPRIEDRILYTLWALASRWGRVTERGTVLNLRLTHEQLAELTSAQRPSVSTALGKLRERGRITYSRGSFVLCGDVPGEVQAPEKQVALAGDPRPAG